jgi:hypothetical protein
VFAGKKIRHLVFFQPEDYLKYDHVLTGKKIRLFFKPEYYLKYDHVYAVRKSAYLIISTRKQSKMNYTSLALENPAHDYVLASKKNPPFFFAENNLK